jgi:predicted DCC family thiol-disulfide oxidoreductase YuxK
VRTEKDQETAPLVPPAEQNPTAALTVYFDGSCPLCSAEIGHYSGLAGSERLCFVDVSAPGADAGTDLPTEAALRRFHVRQADGRLLSGAPAFVAIWGMLPAWSPAARLARVPGAVSLLELGYRLFLPVRPLLSRVAAALGARPMRGPSGIRDPGEVDPRGA